MKTRIKFSKCGSMRFVGHLDVMRYFQKAFRRAQIPVSYSQGFSPHQLMSFSSPLGIGLSSDGEYMDLTLDQVEDADRIVEQMNEQMNEEIRVRNLTILKDDARPSMAMLAACDYMIAAKPDFLFGESRSGGAGAPLYGADFDYDPQKDQAFGERSRYSG